MGNTKKSKGSGRESPWVFRPNLPKEPTAATPGAWEAYTDSLREHREVYRLCEKAPNRNEAMRALMIDGHRYRQANMPELERLAEMGREFERVFGGIGPGQVADLMDRFMDRLGVRAEPMATQVPWPAEPNAAARQERIKAAADRLAGDDPLDGELS